MNEDRFAAYSYMLNKQGSNSEEQQCSGIPREDREEFHRQIQKCIKQEEIITPLKGIYRRLNTLANPTVSVHLIKKQANQLCVSRQRVNVCPRNNQALPIVKKHLQGNIPAEVRPRNVEFTCVDLPSQKAFSLERRAKRGDNLQAELNRLPVHFSTTEYEPVLCNQKQQEQQQQQQQQVHQQKKQQQQKKHQQQQQQQFNNQFNNQFEDQFENQFNNQLNNQLNNQQNNQYNNNQLNNQYNNNRNNQFNDY